MRPRLILFIALSLLITSCSSGNGGEASEFFKKIFRKDTYQLYRIDIQQGNTLDPNTLAKLKLGMSKEQVYYLLGNPVAENVFHKNQWNYTYYLIPGKGKVQQYRLTLLFEQGRLHKINKSKELAALINRHKQQQRRRRSVGTGGDTDADKDLRG